MNVLQRLDELIEESREIEALAQKLQAAGPLHPAPLYAVQQFQKRHEAWYAATLEPLPADLRERFELEWTGPEGDCGQHDFVAESTGTGPDQRHVYDDAHLRTIDPTKLRFTYPYNRCFQVPLLRQRRILIEAKHHADIARRGRFGERDAEARLDINDLHPVVLNAAGELFADRYFRNAILQACIALAGTVREKSGSTIKTDAPLMEHVFSAKSPVLKASEDEDERQGMMWLFKGAAMGLRNPRAHHLGEGEDLDRTEAFEWLAFISGLMRVLDRAERVAPDSDLL